MKKLSIEEKAERYDEAIEGLQEILSSGEDSIKMSRLQLRLQGIFPELKESEGEKVKAWLMDTIKQVPNDSIEWETIDKSSVLAWIERQGEKEYALKSFKDEDVHKFMQYIEKQSKAYEFNLPNRGYDIYAFAKDILCWLEKQCQVKESVISQHEIETCCKNGNSLTGDDEMIRKDIIRVFKGETSFTSEKENEKYIAWLEKQSTNPYSGVSFKYNGHTFGMCAKDCGVEILIDSNLKAFISLDKSFIYPSFPQPILVSQSAPEASKEEMVDNQNCIKSADKIGPKFKVDDWITNSIETVQFTGYDIDYGYQVDYEGNLLHRDTDIIEKEYRLWNINDAKDGDVLVDEDNNIGIYKGKDDIDWDSYIYLGCDGKLRGFSIGGRHEQTDTHPATKEQRDTLEKAMSDTGYIFDFEKKELKKIENEIEECKIEHIEHGKYYYCIKDYFCGGKKQASKGDVVQALRGMSIMALGAKANEYFLPVNFIKYISSWSEEDERNMQNIDSVLFYDKKLPEDTCVKLRNFLKSLKDRVGCDANCTTTWNPSDEQIEALEHFVRSIGESGYASPYENNTKLLYSLLEQLKKL